MFICDATAIIFTEDEMTEYNAEPTSDFIVASIQGVGAFYEVLLDPNDTPKYSVISKSPVKNGRHMWWKRDVSWVEAMIFVTNEVAESLITEGASREFVWGYDKPV